jgi:hypothetical protein
MIFSPKLVAHYRELKAQAPDCLLLMQVDGAPRQAEDTGR